MGLPQPKALLAFCISCYGPGWRVWRCTSELKWWVKFRGESPLKLCQAGSDLSCYNSLQQLHKGSFYGSLSSLGTDRCTCWHCAAGSWLLYFTHFWNKVVELISYGCGDFGWFFFFFFFWSWTVLSKARLVCSVSIESRLINIGKILASNKDTPASLENA